MAERAAFRPDLEGLRGVAILLVVGFHAGAQSLAGGFVGVDVFFVLSGYFITAMLAREVARTGRVDLTAFWGGRAMRLLPALLIVLLFTLAAVMWLYAPIDRPPIASGARAVALYSANLEFARHSVDYFRSAENPLLHTWSLAVEEQFYLVWPLLFVLLAIRTAAWTAADEVDDSEEASKRKLRLAMVLLGFISFGIAVWLTRIAQPWAFYGMGTRLWEFALGGLLAVTLGDAIDEVTWPATMLSVMGMVALGIAVATYHRGTPYPGMAALLPALGTVALIVGGARAPQGWPARAFSAGWLRWLGRMSYAWYLWHWPLIGIGGVLDSSIGVGGRLAWSGVALALAWLTHRWIETPARSGRWDVGPRWLAPAALAASVGAAIVAHQALRASERQVSTVPQKIFAAAREDRMAHACWGTTIDEWTGPCAFGDTQSTTTLVLLGDSHAEHWLGALDRIGKDRGWKIVALVKGGCPVADMRELRQTRLLRRWYGECARYREGMIRRILEMRPTAVLLSSWDHYVSINGHRSDWQVTAPVWLRGLRRTYARLTDAGIRTLAMRGTPRTWFDVPQCLSRREARLPFARECVYERDEALSTQAVAAQNRAARGLPVTFIDMNDQICASRRCGVMRNGAVIFTDDNHLTATFSRSLAPVLGSRLTAALGEPVVASATGGVAR
jgi:peptidoglycan/LPS O-acetylase OafA/YrhL